MKKYTIIYATKDLGSYDPEFFVRRIQVEPTATFDQVFDAMDIDYVCYVFEGWPELERGDLYE